MGPSSLVCFFLLLLLFLKGGDRNIKFALNFTQGFGCYAVRAAEAVLQDHVIAGGK